MAPIAPKPPLGNVLVIGGCGFLGHHIVDLLHSSYQASISVLDLRTTRNRRPDADGVQYFDGDVTSIDSILPIFQKTKPDVVIHTASPTLAGGSKEMYRKVNVEGTRTVIEACEKAGVTALVYTSSASVIHDNHSDLINADERWPVIPPKLQTEYYSLTKAEAEGLVLAANRPTSFLTTSLRPAGIYGEGDVQILPPILAVYRNGQTGFQLGPNTNLFDFTYVGNVAHAHCLAALALIRTSQLKTIPTSHERVDGEAFMITNDEPVYFWDFARAVWKAAGSDKGTEHVWVIGYDTGMALGAALEWVMWAVGRKSKLTRREVKYSSMTRYYDCSKAKKRLGYRPLVSLQEGITRGVQWFEAERLKEGEKKEQ